MADLFNQLVLEADAREAGNPGELAASASALRTILDALPYGVLVFDADHRVLFANAGAAAALGPVDGEPEAVVGQLQDVFQLVDPETEASVSPEQSPLARAFEGQREEPREFLVRRLHSAARQWVLIGAQPVLDDEGAVRAVVLTLQDIGERKKRELAFGKAAKLSSVIYRENLAGIIHVTIDGRILDCNGALVRMLGYRTRRELLAVRVPRIYYDSADRDKILRLLATSRRLSEYEVCLRCKDGSRCWVLLNARLLDSVPGEVGGSVVSTVIDITPRKQQEETLRRSEQRFAAFMRNLPGVSYIKNTEGAYLYYNEACLTRFQRRPEELVGRTDAEIWPGEEAVRTRENDLTVVATQRAAEFIETIEQPDGKHTWLMCKFPIVENNEVVLVCGIGVDITERAILEEQLAQARKMEALGRLAGGVAHDFNNLLTVIAGYGQLALESIGNAPPERLTTYMREILDSSRRASALTGQLLAFSRRQALQPTVLDLGDLLRGMERLLQRVIGEHIELTVQNPGSPCLIQADANQMEQAVMNLAVNARDAMPLGGALTLRCERLAISEENDEPGDAHPPLAVLLEVRDTGIGMDNELREKIFDPFFTSKEKGRGTGLGLSTVYGVVSQAKGKIEVDSVPGQGTVFRIYFPLAIQVASAASGSPKPSGTPRGHETVLLVEDDASVRTLAETILTRQGYEVVVADCGAAAIRLWEERSGKLDVLLTDVIMPQMSGGELAHKLRERCPHLRVLFMSGYTDDMIASHGVLAGETQLIQKPFTAEALGRKLRAVLDA